MGGGYGGPPPAGGSGKPNVALFAILGVLIAAVIGGGIFLLTSGDDDDDDSTELTDQDQDSDLDLPDLDEDTPDTTEGDTPDTTDGSDSSGGDIFGNADVDVSEIEGMSDASQVILSFIGHEVDKNCDGMWSLVGSSFPDETEFVTQCEETYGGFGGIVVDDVSVSSVTDSEIVVESNQTIDGSAHLSTYTMVLEGGTWWIDSWD